MAERQGLATLIRQTKQFINEDPFSVVLSRPNVSDDGAGGKVEGEPTDVPEQVVRLVPANPSASAESRTVSGEVLKTQYSVVGMPDADIREGDSFKINGARHEVAIVIVVGGYVTRAEVVRRG